MKASTIAPILLIAAVGLAGCSGEEQTAPDTAPSTPATSTQTSASTPTETATMTETETATATATDGATDAETTAGSGANTGGFDINSASEDEIASRLEQAGVPDANTWATRIKENGPYTADNATSKLRELAQKYPLDINTLNEIRRALGF